MTESMEQDKTRMISGINNDTVDYLMTLGSVNLDRRAARLGLLNPQSADSVVVWYDLDLRGKAELLKTHAADRSTEAPDTSPENYQRQIRELAQRLLLANRRLTAYARHYESVIHEVEDGMWAGSNTIEAARAGASAYGLTPAELPRVMAAARVLFQQLHNKQQEMTQLAALAVDLFRAEDMAERVHEAFSYVASTCLQDLALLLASATAANHGTAATTLMTKLVEFYEMAESAVAEAEEEEEAAEEEEDSADENLEEGSEEEEEEEEPEDDDDELDDDDYGDDYEEEDSDADEDIDIDEEEEEEESDADES